MDAIYKDFSDSAALIGKLMFPQKEKKEKPSILENIQAPLKLLNKFINPG
jgi:hypothetical protein|tara:strand:+ start:628 stop:777 length:150 start_codon:yes stop_codon:yes gene_type:complete